MSTKRKHFGIKDLLYGFGCLLVVATVYNHFDIHIAPKGSLLATPVHAQDQQVAPRVIEVSPTDKRVDKLHSFLESQGSPLAPYAQLIVTDSDNNAIDWTKMVAISGMESNYCKNISQERAASYNCWGLGGDNFIYFSSYEEAIGYTASLLGNQYKQEEMEGIKTKYCPALDGCNPAWASIVTDKSNQILQTEEK